MLKMYKRKVTKFMTNMTDFRDVPCSWVDIDQVSEEFTASIIRVMLRNIGQYLPDYTAQHPRRQPSSY
jgi:hypothetical protein